MGQQAQFSERERQVIELLLQGKSNKQIALALGVSLRTVEYHLSHIYNKLGVTSRTEAALQLSQTDLRESAGMELRESTGLEADESGDNKEAFTSTWRLPVSRSFLIGLGILILTSIFCYLSLSSMVKERSEAYDSDLSVPNPTGMPPFTLTARAETSTPAISPKEHILEQISQLAAEYEQAVQAEKKSGDVQFSKDPASGEEIFLFQGESFTRISELRNEFHNQMNGLIALYAQIYRDETNPTPFPTLSALEQKQSYLNSLYEQAQNYCSNRDLDIQNATIVFYDPDDGKYYPLLIDDEMARCHVYGQMIEEWRTAPELAKINKQADMAQIRRVMGRPEMKLKFQSVSELSNAPWQSTALYTDETGTKYYVDIDTSRLAAIEPNIPGHPDISPADRKSMDELRGIARQFASTNSPRVAELESILLYEENCKGEICFFRWDYRSKDWSGTDWVMMPPFLQVGIRTDGQILTYNNTLDLFE